jgi:ABC-type multidrug transport system fused ATPase/permease subunit
VPQSPTILAGTIADNVRLGDPAASDERVRSALELARATGFVDALPAGAATVVGERGLQLSGGQRQRLAIARAALRNAPVVVLDEPTAHLDDELEADVVAAFAELLRDRTALVVAHRPSTAAMADRVVRLEAGRVVGSPA